MELYRDSSLLPAKDRQYVPTIILLVGGVEQLYEQRRVIRGVACQQDHGLKTLLPPLLDQCRFVFRRKRRSGIPPDGKAFGRRKPEDRVGKLKARTKKDAAGIVFENARDA